jgi:hypothetical protein
MMVYGIFGRWKYGAMVEEQKHTVIGEEYGKRWSGKMV